MIVDPALFVTWAQMRPAVLARASECPSFLLDNAMRRAAREFFKVSRVWRTERNVLLTTAAATLAYPFTAPTEAQLASVQSAWLGGREMHVALPGDEDVGPDDTDCPRIGAREPDTLYLTHEPDAVGVDVVGVAALMPAAAATGIPAEAWSGWYHALSCGAASFLVTEPNKPWSNPNAQVWLRREFDDGITQASMSAGPTRRRSLRMQPL
jgi:hypothetical protein